MIEQTLDLIKPDGVQRGLIGESIKRFEQRGLKIVGVKMTIANEALAKNHYTEDISKRRGENVRNALLKFITDGPIVVMIIQGVNAIENVRKICGDTESKSALPGTIRGDFSHVSYECADEKKIPIKNIIHASGNKEDAEREIKLWFSQKEIYNYKINHEENLY